MKITRIELCHPVNRPGKHDDTLRSLSESDDWTLEADELLAGISITGVRATKEGVSLFIPMSNIRSIS